MSLERLQRLNRRLRSVLSELAVDVPEPDRWPHPPELGRAFLASMLTARHLDTAAFELRASGDGHYTICSAGHEANVVFGGLTRPSDPALLHYRSAAVQIERARQVPGSDPARDILLSLVASSEDPVSGGRHKVFGGKALGIIPKTSTIASHLPRAVGLALMLERRRRLGLACDSPEDAIVLCSLGDASVNHSTAAGALGALGWAVHQRLTAPLLVVVEDNGLGISVRTPSGWIEQRLAALPHVARFQAAGWELAETYAAARQAVEHCRKTRRPAVLHLRCFRLLGHAGSDADTGYRSPAEIERAEGHDPVLAAALDLARAGVLHPEEILELDEHIGQDVRAEAARARLRPKLRTAAEVASAIALEPDRRVEQHAERALRHPPSTPMTLAQGINWALSEALERYPEALIFGEDVAKKGGVYGVTKGLLAQAGPARVFNTLLDEQSILGLALGAANLDLLPIPEIQYLAYLHNAEDQLRGEAATMRFFSRGAYDNPMVVRIAGLGYQKGFGGHFHNDNSLAVLRDIPGIVLLVPARADDAVELLRTALALARAARRVVVIVEPIALYHTRDLYAEGDGAWLAACPKGAAPFAKGRLYPVDDPNLVLVTFGNGVRLSRRAALRLEREHGLSASVLDLRFLAPLPAEDILAQAARAGRVLVVDETRRSGGVSEAILALLVDAGSPAKLARVTSADSFIPLGEAAEQVLVSEAQILERALWLCRQ
ncbi:MAG TPA: thiamine pyrophosphate-dependent enzyme [Polyangiaceae bacterium]|nr:thiamine pyrophosphate-dependent enzyme [Polyangiaceae bacterium]